MIELMDVICLFYYSHFEPRHVGFNKACVKRKRRLESSFGVSHTFR